MDHDDIILRMLLFRSAKDPLSSKEIARRLHISDIDAQPITRSMILNMMKAKRIAVGANNRGYWLLQSEKEMEHYLRRLEGRCKAIQNRIDLVHECWYERNG